jgi:phospholipid/cholesterol/gamma-HCH transport system permease protein
LSDATAGGPSTDVSRVDVTRSADGAIVIGLSGDWTLTSRIPDLDKVAADLDGAPSAHRIAFESSSIGRWDSGLLTFVVAVIERANAQGIDVDLGGLPRGAQILVALATAVPAEKGAHQDKARPSFLATIGNSAIAFGRESAEVIAFIGEAGLSFGRMITGRARFRRSDLWEFIQQAGADALPIVSLISLLQGLTMAFLGAAQLSLFGAQVFVANLIGLSMAAEIGAVMTAIIMAGRTGAAYAAQIGTMQVNQEIDALTTLGLKPMDFLVLPRMIALIVMMPLLYLYANLLGMFGGGLIAVTVLDLSVQQYMTQLFGAVPLTIFATGLLKSAVFGLLVAVCGCMQGMACGRSASAVGEATTSAVVMSIVAIIVADGIFGVVNPPLVSAMG